MFRRVSRLSSPWGLPLFFACVLFHQVTIQGFQSIQVVPCSGRPQSCPNPKPRHNLQTWARYAERMFPQSPSEGYQSANVPKGFADAPTVVLKPVPMSKNAGHRMVALVWDQDVDTKGRDAAELHHDRNELVEDHVMFCRKRNLYNETFNQDSMVDIFRSLHILSSDVRRTVGHAMLLDTPEVRHAYDMLKEEPILQDLADGDTANVQLYRWHHIRDYTLRQDDGRFGFPCMLIALDHDGARMLRNETTNSVREYLIRSERVIAAGPLHMPTESKTDPMAVGDFILFNAKDREAAIEFAENLPSAVQGLYREMRVHFYNTLDVTGKFVSEDRDGEAPCAQMQEALEYWGYPTDDKQTPWLNW